MNFAEIAGRVFVWCIFTTLAAVLAPGCSSAEEDGSGSGCGSACTADQRCIEGACRAECGDQSDCTDDLTCVRWRFEDESEGQYCAPLAGQFVACASDAECDTDSGFECADDECRFPCTSHAECSGVGICGAVAGGHFCVREAPAEPGRYYAGCANGPSDCDAAAEFVCIGAGPGDIDAYCTTDCADDVDCPAGFQCGSIASVPCDDACGVAGDPNREGCVPPSEIGPGERYACGPLGVTRRVCEKRGFCSRCERDEDCYGVAGQICARDASGEKICTVPCNPSEDSCPWGNAAECGVWDEELGTATCSHRFGSCRGQGLGCEPCVDDRDCAANGFCARFGFTGERYCVDLGAECDCADDVSSSGTCLGHGCPLTPGGLEMICLAPRSAGDLFGNRCISATSMTGTLPSSPTQGGCWPAN